jgi:hypothetical protein
MMGDRLQLEFVWSRPSGLRKEQASIFWALAPEELPRQLPHGVPEYFRVEVHIILFRLR